MSRVHHQHDYRYFKQYFNFRIMICVQRFKNRLTAYLSPIHHDKNTTQKRGNLMGFHLNRFEYVYNYWDEIICLFYVLSFRIILWINFVCQLMLLSEQITLLLNLVCLFFLMWNGPFNFLLPADQNEYSWQLTLQYEFYMAYKYRLPKS